MATSTNSTAKHDPVWTEHLRMPKFSPLENNVQADVCVVGAGIAGLSTAYMLAKAGRSVVVLDDGTIAGGMTTVTTAHLSNAIDDRFTEIERIRGTEEAWLAASSHMAAIDRIEQIVADEQIDCAFQRVDGYLFLGPKQDAQLLEREMDAARRAGIEATFHPHAPTPSFDTGPCVKFPRQGQFHPLRYLAGLAKAIVGQGGQIYTDTHADKIEGGGFAHVDAGKYRVKTDAIVVATNSPINDLVAIHTKQAPYMTYVIGLRVPAGSVHRALYWDMEEPYHYVRLCDGPESTGADPYDVLIVGGEDHKTGQADDTVERHARLESWARQRFPMAKELEFVWGGQVMETIDGLAFIGRNPMDEENVYVATGDSGMGMTHGTIAGMLLTDLILNRPNRWTDLYDPSRKPPFALGRFLQENVNVARQYFHWLTGSSVSVDEIPKGSGAILRRGLHKVAVYRDDEGAVHECSAVCPHLQCLVEWNAAETTWDCQCHGSRFDKHGHVINGPANEDLAPVETEQQHHAGHR